MLKKLLRDRRNQKRSAKDVFSEVYAQKKWGDKGFKFFSGPGSLDEFAVPYVELMRDYLQANFSDQVTLVDLGCGDFRVGEKLTQEMPGLRYHGVDVVPSMIEHHQAEYANDRIRFDCLDLARDELPKGDVATIRQVLQHLSNAQIMQICKKFDQYQAVFITEHFPAQFRQPNIDIVHGRRTRRSHRSAVQLDQPPFSLTNVSEVLSLAHRKPGERLLTYLYLPTQASK